VVMFDAAPEIFGYPAASVTPSWNLIISHIPGPCAELPRGGFPILR